MSNEELKTTEVENEVECETETTWQSKLKSPVLWSALIFQALSVAVFVGWIDIGTSDFISKTVAAVFQAVATAGLFNNPNNPDGF